MASNAEDALSKCRYDYYDVILCDFNLGAGKNGQQILEELRVRKRLKHTHLFIMITAETAKDVVLGAREYQPDGYIAKPITRTVLEKRLAALLTQQKILKPINREIDLENHAKAITLCHQMLEGKTKYKSWCYQTLAKLYTQVGDTANAEKIYRDVLKTRELPWARLGMGQVLNLEQQYSDAKQCFEEVIKANPNIIEAYDGMSESYLKMGQAKQAQEALQEAVSLSPRMVLRQEKLGNICQQNQDIEAAVNAYRKAVQFGENSIHESVNHYLELGRCLSDWCDGDTSDAGKARAKEATQVLDTAANKFSANEDACLSALLIEARVHAGQGKTAAAEETLHKAECMIEEASLNPDVGLELARTLYALGQDDRAQALLVDLSSRCADMPEVLSRIESLMDEPEGLEARMKAKELNKSGISLFEKGNLLEAIEAFKGALEHTPKHAALNLNLVQVAVKQCKAEFDPYLLKQARICMERISHIPEQHHQFKRLQHFKKLVAKMTSSKTPQEDSPNE